MTPIYLGITLLLVLAVFLMIRPIRGTLFALGASIVALALLGAVYLALASAIVGAT